jgi:RNA recognition motif-containing protein
MGKKLYVGNLSFSVDTDILSNLFAQYGTVESTKIIMDRDTGRSKGFAFVEMSSSNEAQDCLQNLAGQDFEGRKLNVSEARPMEPRRGGF